MPIGLAKCSSNKSCLPLVFVRQDTQRPNSTAKMPSRTDHAVVVHHPMFLNSCGLMPFLYALARRVPVCPLLQVIMLYSKRPLAGALFGFGSRLFVAVYFVFPPFKLVNCFVVKVSAGFISPIGNLAQAFIGYAIWAIFTLPRYPLSMLCS